jgi:hypothetical protein
MSWLEFLLSRVKGVHQNLMSELLGISGSVQTAVTPWRLLSSLDWICPDCQQFFS